MSKKLDTTMLVVAAVGVVIVLAMGLGVLDEWLRNLNPFAGAGEAAQDAENTAYHAATGNLSQVDVTNLNDNLSKAIVQAGGTSDAAAAAVAEQNAWIKNHPPPTPTLWDVLQSTPAQIFGWSDPNPDLTATGP